MRLWIPRAIIFFIICYADGDHGPLLYLPHMTERLRDNEPWLFGIALANMLAIANIPARSTAAKTSTPSSPRAPR